MISAWQTFLNPVLPVFAVLGLGMVLARRGVFDAAGAAQLNRFVFFIGVPALMFGLLSRVDIDGFEPRVLAAYFGSELLVYALGAGVARWLLRRGWRESLLLGMTACFVNHVFFVLPIAQLLHGDAAAAPIAGIIAVDSSVIFCGHVIGLELAAQGTGSVRQIARRLISHPMLLGIAAGLAVNLLGVPVHPGIRTFVGFTGTAAAPVALFALGVVLWSHGALRRDGAALSIAAIKVGLHPLLAFALLAPWVGVPPAWRDSALLVAAGPCGAMPFVLALHYGVPSASIARAVVYSTLASLLTLSLIA